MPTEYQTVNIGDGSKRVPIKNAASTEEVTIGEAYAPKQLTMQDADAPEEVPIQDADAPEEVPIHEADCLMVIVCTRKTCTLKHRTLNNVPS